MGKHCLRLVGCSTIRSHNGRSKIRASVIIGDDRKLTCSQSFLQAIPISWPPGQGLRFTGHQPIHMSIRGRGRHAACNAALCFNGLLTCHFTLVPDSVAGLECWARMLNTVSLTARPAPDIQDRALLAVAKTVIWVSHHFD